MAELVRNLLVDPSALPLLSLVAVINDLIVGHILFTKARIDTTKRPISSVILAPLAVIPGYQQQGFGRALVQKGLFHLEKSGTDLVFVLGHPEYYPQHGFRSAGNLGFEAPYPIPEKVANAWMVKELRDGVIGSIRGKVRCADAMNRPEYWRE